MRIKYFSGGFRRFCIGRFVRPRLFRPRIRPLLPDISTHFGCPVSNRFRDRTPFFLIPSPNADSCIPPNGTGRPGRLPFSMPYLPSLLFCIVTTGDDGNGGYSRSSPRHTSAARPKSSVRRFSPRCDSFVVPGTGTVRVFLQRPPPKPFAQKSSPFTA